MKDIFNKILKTIDFKTIGGRTFALVLAIELALYQAPDTLPVLYKYGFMTALACTYVVMQKLIDGWTKGETSSSSK